MVLQTVSNCDNEINIIIVFSISEKKLQTFFRVSCNVI